MTSLRRRLRRKSGLLVGIAVGALLGVMSTASYFVRPVGCSVEVYDRKKLLMRGITEFGVPPQVVRVAKKKEYAGNGRRDMDKVRCYVFTDEGAR